MWKHIFRKTLLEWARPGTREVSKRPSPSHNFIPCIQGQYRQSLLYDTSNHEGKEEEEKEKTGTCHESRNSYSKLCSGTFLETFGWVGTAVVLALQLRDLCWRSHDSKRRNRLSDSLNQNGHFCRHLCDHLLPMVFNMHSSKRQILCNNISVESSTEPKVVTKEDSSETVEQSSEDISKICQDILGVTIEYFGQLENFAGVSVKDKRQAFLHFKKAVKYGCPRAHFNLGICYETGHGTKVDFIKAVEHYQKASEMGHCLAKYNLGVYYLEGKGGLPLDELQGLELIAQAANKGVLQAQTHMGIHYIEQQDWNKALPYLKEASKQDAEAKYYLGMCYENGWGVPSSHEQALELYQEAAEGGNSDALHVLGIHYEKDRSSETDKTSKPTKGIHSYSSVPELHSYKEEISRELSTRKEVSRYLDIVFPSVWKKRSSSQRNIWANDSGEMQETVKNEFSMKNQSMVSAVGAL